MKKLFFAASMVLGSLALTASPAPAKTFGLFPHCGLCCGGCGKCCSTFCVRQYNAFTPVCCGSVTCMGCTPFSCGGPGCGGPGCGGPGYGYPGYGAPGYGYPAPEAPCCGGVVADPNLPPAPAGTNCSMRTPPPQPYAGPVQTAAYYQPNAYGYAPMMAPSVAGMGAQPWYWSQGGSGR
jgi:hypothetical protein